MKTFKQYFVESEKIYYHGTNKSTKFIDFESSRDALGMGVIWFTPSKRYAGKYKGRKGHIYEVHLTFKNPLYIQDSKKDSDIFKEIRAEAGKRADDMGGDYHKTKNMLIGVVAKEMGYDSIIQFKGKEVGVFNSNQIKIV